MNIRKAENRDRKINRRRHGHRVDGRSVFLIEEVVQQKAKRARKQAQREAEKEFENQ